MAAPGAGRQALLLRQVAEERAAGSEAQASVLRQFSHMWRRKGGQGTSRIFFFPVAVTKTGKSAKFFIFCANTKTLS
jgi:hypothetical protein